MGFGLGFLIKKNLFFMNESCYVPRLIFMPLFSSLSYMELRVVFVNLFMLWLKKSFERHIFVVLTLFDRHERIYS